MLRTFPRLAIVLALLIPFIASAQEAPVAAKPAINLPNRHTFESNGVKLHYLDEGEGEPVILIHGFGANLDLNWTGLIPRLRKEFRVIALDNRGHGRSEKPRETGAYGMNMVEDVARLMDHLKLEKAHIVGYSMGSLITGKFLDTHPERCLSVVIGGMGWLEITDQWRSLMEEITASLEQGKGPMPLLKFLHPDASPERVRTVNTAFSLFNDQKALAQCVRQFPEFAFPKETLTSNRLPALVIVGENDPFKTHVDKMEGVMAHAKIVVVPGQDHMTTFNHLLFLETVETFLKGNRADKN